MSTTKASDRRDISRTIVGASVAAAFALAIFLALPPSGAAPPEFLEFFGRFHTLAVHLPLGVLLLIATAELLTRFPRLRERIDPALGLALPFLVATAVAAFALGVLLARGGGYPSKLVGLHRAFTLGAVLGSAVCMVAWVARERPDGSIRRTPYRVALALTVGLLTIGAHFGGSMTHGESYLTRFAPQFVQRMLGAASPAPPVVATADPGAEPLVFADAIMPVLKRECVECHGPDKSKGGLRLDTLAAIVKGGEDGAAVVPGHGATSALVKRMLLPAADDDHMPPAEKPQSTADEIALFTWWIDRGANDTLRVREAMVPDGAKAILGKTLGATGSTSPTPTGSTPTNIAGSPDGVPGATTTAANPTASAAASASPGSARLAYRDVVAPILSARCGSCHGSGKQKGKLRVDSLSALLAGGKSGPAIVPGSASAGTILTRVHLAPEDDKHMPPSDEAQLTAAQVQVLTWWAAHGANDTLSADSMPSALASVGTGGARPNRPAPAPTVAAMPSTSTSTSTPTPTATATSTPTASPAAPSIVAGPGRVALYQDVVAPILTQRCGECHSGKHTEAGMRVDDLAALVRDQDLVPGKPNDSPLVSRMLLASSDSDHMPPKDKPQPTASEVTAVKTWVAAGAKADQVVAIADLPADVVPPSARAASGPVVAANVEAPRDERPPGTAVPLRASGCGACAVGSAERCSALSISIAALVALSLGARRKLARHAPVRKDVALNAAARKSIGPA